MSARFSTTQWSVVLTARDHADTSGKEALAGLCEKYWFPLFSFVRRQGSDPDAAADLTQEFFRYLLEENLLKNVERSAGRFRSFLLASLRHFLSHERERARAQKRGGNVRILSLDAAAANARYVLEPIDRLTPEEIFEHRWALTVLERALERLHIGLDDQGRARFDRLRPYLFGERPAPPYAQLATELDTTEGAVRNTIHRLRRRFGEEIRAEIADTVSIPEEIDDEVRHLLGVVCPLEPRQGA